MPTTRRHIPKYRHYKPKDLGVVHLAGRDIYLGKVGIPHVEAPEFLLANMLTLRLHIDAMTAENGPLSVIPGSHRLEQQAKQLPVELGANVGDVLAMRPLLSHSSSMSRKGTTSHRRIIHLEFASCAELPEGYEWHAFKRVGS